MGRSGIVPGLAGIAIAVAVLGLRSLGWLQGSELALYDLYLRASPKAPSSAVVLVEITEDDIREQGHYPFHDRIFSDLLTWLHAAGARAVGLDIYRDLDVPPGTEELADTLRENPRTIAVTKFGYPDGVGIRGPAALEGSGRIGFNDLPPDRLDATVRRSLLFMDDGEGEVQSSFALLLALRALADEGVYPRGDESEPSWLRLGPHTLEPLAPDAGAYRELDSAGYQILMDYGANSFETWSLGEVLAGEVDPSEIEGRIVIVGGHAESLPEVFPVPTGGRRPGMEVHAQVVDQLLRIARGESAPRRTWGEGPEVLLILLVGVLGCLLALQSPRRLALGGMTLVAAVFGGLFLLVAAGYVAFLEGWWVPMLAPCLAWLGSAGLVTAWVSSRERAERESLMGLFARHVSPRVADEIWRRRDEFLAAGRPRPQRLVATVLFVDIKGYTARAEAMDPAELMDWVNEFMDAMANAIERHDGVVDDYFGDGIKANFGVPIPRETDEEIAGDAENAVRCALTMSKTLGELNARYRVVGLPECAMRIGINTGAVVAGSLGATGRLKFTVVGDVVVVAQRLESTSEVEHAFERYPCRILASEATCTLLSSDIETEPVGEIALRGMDAKVFVRRILDQPGA